MANVPRKSKKSGKKSGRRGAKRSAPKLKLNKQSKLNVPEMASCTVTRSATPITSGSLVVYNDLSLDQFTRASVIGASYQRFRISGVTVTIKPNMDAFTSVAAGNPQKPYIYFVIDKGGNIPTNITLEGLKRLGCVPHRLDEKPFKISWRPAVTYGVLDFGIGSQYQSYKTSPWLSTNANAPGAAPILYQPSGVNHLGLKLFIEQVGAITTFNVDVSAQFQFIKPSFNENTTPVPPQMLTYAAVNSSADGIAGTMDDLSGNPIMH